ncbi:MAG: PKD domain-containing protein [Flavitalea sp.]
MTAVRGFSQSGQSSFEFVENKGQWDKSVLFRGELFSAEFYTQKKGFTVALHNTTDIQKSMGLHGGNYGSPNSGKDGKIVSYKEDLSGRIIDKSITSSKIPTVVHSHAYSVEFVRGNENATVVPDKMLSYYNNYFMGNDPSKWATKVRIFQAVLYKDVYPNIDVRYYSEDGRLKYDLIVKPGGDPSNIALKYTGADKILVKNNELVVKTSVGDIKELYPYTFQSDNIKGRREIQCKYVVTGSTVKFQVANYDKKSVLVIDPTLIFSSFTGSLANQYGFTATPGPDGSLYSGGIVFGSDFPTTAGAYQKSFAGGGTSGTDIGIMKFSSKGDKRVYATYLGGDGNDYPHSLICDPQGNLICMGRSYSDNYPGKVVGSKDGGSIVVSKFNADGTALIGSLIIGGTGLDGVNVGDIQQSQVHGGRSLLRNYGDDSRSEVTLDANNNIYVAAQTQSNDFPIIGGGFQSASGGKQDGVVMKIADSCNNIIWSTYLGGAGDDGAFVIDINPLNNNVYVAGGTTTTGSAGTKPFPGIAAGTIGATYQGGETDGFITILTNNGQLIKSTYIGSSGIDIIYGLKFDRKGFPYVMGTTRGQWQKLHALYGSANNSQFIAKIEPDLSKYDYTTTFGSGSKKPNISPVAFLVDRCENVYISGWGGWIDTSKDPYDQAGVAGMPIKNPAPDKYFKSTTDGRDFYFIVIQKNAADILFGCYFGQTGGRYGEHVDGGTSRYDQQGVIYQAICANCLGGAKFPTSPGVIGPVNGAQDGCNLAAVKIAFNFAGVAAGPESFVNGLHDSVGYAPFTVNLQDTVRNAKSYEWSFGDGSNDTATVDYQLIHTYDSVGLYKVRLIAIDSNKCNIRDTAYTYVKVGSDKVDLKMLITKVEPCESLEYKFENLSTFTNKPFNDSSFVWDFGDGTRLRSTLTGPLKHYYASPGTYHVELVLVDTGYCNSPDSIGQILRVNPLVKAQFETPSVGCAPYDAVFTNTSLAGQRFHWDFGDGDTSNVDNPTHAYPNPGTFTIHLIAYDDGTCNKVSDTSMTITVSGKPTAEFSWTPVVPVQNKPTIFTNLSTGGVKYEWIFGDGDTLVKNTPDTVLHQYNASGTYNACLVTFNEFGCTDTACHEVQADVLPLFDVPNAFTPGKFGRNSVVRVEGFGITKLIWRIYNRYGQKVFESNSKQTGWNGTFNGQLLPMDVYGYTLDVEFSDGTKKRRTGDITLLR